MVLFQLKIEKQHPTKIKLKNSFKIMKGDKVKLKSGGPVMTIESIEENLITCIWFEKDKLIRENFIKETIQEYEDWI